MTSGGSNFNDFPENQLTKIRGLNNITGKVNHDHAFFRSKQDFFTTVNINILNNGT